MIDKIKQQISASIGVKQAVLDSPSILSQIERVAKLISEAMKEGKKILIAGNGGSAADAQHMAGEFVSRFYFDRPGLPAMALTTDTSILTAIGNDYGFERIFSRQIEANANRGDIFVGISTSGTSPNILKAVEACKAAGVVSVGMTGASGGKMEGTCDICIKAPSNETPRIQEAHALIEHIICCLVEAELFCDPKK